MKVVALAGGVGGAKFADGLAQVLQPNQLTVIVNTGDDFTHMGLRISPDLDTVCYTLAGISNPDTGWGRSDETWNVLSNLKDLGMPDWFQLGDADLATHITRTVRMNSGWTLSQITQEFCRIWGVKTRILPMSDQPTETRVKTDKGILEFQEYFVQKKCTPIITGFIFNEMGDAIPAPGVLDALKAADAVVICPSNPWVSIDPILNVLHIKSYLDEPPVLAVSPIIGNHALRGPAAKMFSELGIEPSAYAVAQHYGSIIDGLVIDNSDSSQVKRIEALGMYVYQTDIIMHDRLDRKRLALEVLEWLEVLQR